MLSWGHGGHGQLGNSSLHNQKVPIPVEALTHEKVIYIACGGSSSAAITGKHVTLALIQLLPLPIPALETCWSMSDVHFSCIFSLLYKGCNVGD